MVVIRVFRFHSRSELDVLLSSVIAGSLPGTELISTFFFFSLTEREWSGVDGLLGSCLLYF